MVYIPSRTFGENMKEMKIVGRKRGQPSTLERAKGFLRLVARLHRGNPLHPKGVFRFRSFEEADAWTMKMITRDRSQGRRK